MSTEKLATARSVAKALLPSENTIDDSIVKSAQLLIAIVEGRMKSGMAAETVHDAVMSASAGLTALGRARDHVVTCHKQLSETRDAHGLNPRAVGCQIGKLLRAEQELTVVPFLKSA